MGKGIKKMKNYQISGPIRIEADGTFEAMITFKAAGLPGIDMNIVKAKSAKEGFKMMGEMFQRLAKRTEMALQSTQETR
jgi:hypothetical protein